MSCQAGPGIEPGPPALKASALPIELTWQTKHGYQKNALLSICHSLFASHLNYGLLLWGTHEIISNLKKKTDVMIISNN